MESNDLTVPTDLEVRCVEHHIPRGDGYIYAREYAGSAPAFVLLHGFPDNLHIYDLLIPHLVAAGRHVIAFDFLGFGASSKPKGAVYSFEQQLGDLEAVADFFKLLEIVPVGHDAGGTAAINFTLAHPDKVLALCLLNTFYAATPNLRIPELIELFAIPDLKALADAMAADAAQVTFLLAFQQGKFKQGASQHQIDTINDLVEPIIRNNFFQKESALPAFAQMAGQAFTQVQRNTERLAELKGIDRPCTIIWGAGDEYLNSNLALDIAATIPGATVHNLDAGHWPQLDAPQDVARLLLK